MARFRASPTRRAQRTATSIEARGHPASPQQLLGNRALSALLQPASSGATLEVGADLTTIRRIPMKVENRPEEKDETLYNRPGTAPATTAPNTYGLGKRDVDMSRGGAPEAVTIKVKTRFINQARKLNAAGNGSTDDATTRSVIPPGDERIGWAQGLAGKATSRWNGKVLFNSKKSSLPFSPGGPVSLPVQFVNEAVFDLATACDQEVALFGSATAATGTGTAHPIDAGHLYMNKGTVYAGMDDEAIYAHEYGHWIGLADEYSMSNLQAHALMHRVSPGTSANAGKALDRETVRRMVMAALTRPLYDRLDGAGPEIAKALQKGQANVGKGMSAGLLAALADPATLAAMGALVPASAGISAAVPGALSKAAKAVSRDSKFVAGILATEMATGSLTTMINDSYFKALGGTTTGTFNAGDAGGININIGGSAGPVGGTGVFGAAATGPLAASAGGIADKVVGPAGTPGIPPVRPSASLIRTISSLPAGWDGLGKAVPAQMSGSALSATISAAAAGAMVATLFGAGVPKVEKKKLLAAAALAATKTAASTALSRAVREFLAAEINPLIQSSVSAINSEVQAEVDSVMNTPAGAVAAGAPKDPNVVAAVAAMKTRLEASQKAAEDAQKAAAGTTKSSPGGAAPDQDVTYSSANMMSSNQEVFRPDQFAHLLAGFNSKLKTWREDPFTMTMK